MAIRLKDKPNTQQPIVGNLDYPYGKIKDNDGGGNGTPVNELVYNDSHQFFERLIQLSGIVANGLREGLGGVFQYYEALIITIKLWAAFKGEIRMLGSVDSVLGSFNGSGVGSGIYAGWQICNGNNGSANLVDRFIKATATSANIAVTGGANSFILNKNQVPQLDVVINDPLHSHSIPYPNLTANADSGGTGGAISTGTVTNTTSTAETGLKGTGAGQNVFVGTNTPNPISNQPSFYTLLFIQKMS